jgi:hypothetical protein
MADPNTDNNYPILAATATGTPLSPGAYTATVSPPEVGSVSPASGGQPPRFIPSALGGPFTITVSAGGRTGQLVGTVLVEPLAVTLGTGIPK